jgi:hypothetical protein
MQYQGIDNIAQIIAKFESQFLNTHNIFYKFLNLAVIFKKGKIALLKKRNGPERRTLARPAQIRGLPGPRLAEPVRHHLIQIGWRVAFLPRAPAHAGEAAWRG